MAEQGEHGISWCQYTANPWWGCVKLPGNPLCDNCYADSLDRRYAGVDNSHWGLAARRRFIQSTFPKVEAWNRKAEGADIRPRVFWMSMGDIFEDLPAGHLDGPEMAVTRQNAFLLMERTTNLHHLLLTKRVSNVAKMVPASWLKDGGWPLHIRVGCSVGTQKDANREIPRLLLLPCPNFLSMEPLLELVILRGSWLVPVYAADDPRYYRDRVIDGVITGGESGPQARPGNPDWYRSLRDQCAEYGVPFHFKQWGEWASVSEVEGEGRMYVFEDGRTVRRVGKKNAGRTLDGVTHDAFPDVPNVNRRGLETAGAK